LKEYSNSSSIMRVTVGRIVRMWPDHEVNNSFMLFLEYDLEGGTIIDNIISNNDNESMMNYVGKHIYICDITDVPNNIVIGPDGRRTGRLVLWNDGSIRLVQNNHTEVGQRVDIH